MTRVLVRVAEPALRDAIVRTLASAAVTAIAADDADAVDAAGTHGRIDVLVLDRDLTGDGGAALAAGLRQRMPAVGIVMLDARAALDDRLHALSLGADACLARSQDLRELVLVVLALTRRQALESQGWRLDPFLRTIRPPQGEPVALTNGECALLEALSRAWPQPCSRADLAAALGHPEPDFDPRRLEMLMSRLRRKLESDRGGPALLRTVRGTGYALTVPVTLRVYRRR